jgi:hypothetical protein
MRTQIIKVITIVSLSAVVTVSSPHIAIADIEVPGQSKAESKFVEVPQNDLKELAIDLSLVPQAVEFEGFINYGSRIQSTSTNTLGQTITGVIRPNVITPNVINQPIFSTRKVPTADGGPSNLQQLIKERDELKQRLLEVEALIKKNANE